jgi:hypothetical protein
MRPAIVPLSSPPVVGVSLDGEEVDACVEEALGGI